MCMCVKERCDTDNVDHWKVLLSACRRVNATGVYPHRFDHLAHLRRIEQRVYARLCPRRPRLSSIRRSCRRCMIGRPGSCCQVCRWVMVRQRRSRTAWLTRLTAVFSDCIYWIQIFKWVSKGVIGNWFLCKERDTTKSAPVLVNCSAKNGKSDTGIFPVHNTVCLLLGVSLKENKRTIINLSLLEHLMDVSC